MRWFVIIWLISSASGDSKHDADYERYLEFVASEEERGLFPSIFNLATSADVTTNATCGQEGPESYCKLVEHVFMRQPQCDICDDTSVEKRHPINFINDGTNKWWQSPSLANGLDYEAVTITLDLRQEYQVAYVIVKSGIAPRPGTWVLERSLDGKLWKPWHYYVTHDSECMKRFGVPATRGVIRFKKDDEVICSSYYSKLDPIENGEIHTSLVNGRPGIDGPSLTLQEFTKARHVRLRFLRLRTLNADLMIITRSSHGRYIDKSVTRRYFYAIKDISIGGQCICYGHAESCPVDSVTAQFRCECKHNTCGESCNKCCPLFNAMLWMPGTNTEPHICQPCQCFSHADSCHYEEEIERDGLSVSPDGIYEGGGVCDNCKHNTQGFNCEECKDFYYRPSGISHYREDACRSCDCDVDGSVDGTCIKDDTRATNGLRPGDCLCKPGFGGRRCDRCALGYRNYPTCEPCPCNKAGAANYATCEDTCICKENVEGVYCDRCKAGFINLDDANPGGCQACFCFGITEQCMQIEWGKEKIRDLIGWNLTDIDGRRDVTPMHENGNSLTYKSGEIDDRTLYYWKAPEKYTNNQLNSYSGMLQYYVYYVPENEGPQAPLADVIIEGNGIKIEYHSRQEFFERENVSVQIRLHESAGWYNSQTRQPVTKREFMRTLADVHMFLIRAMYHHYQIQSSLYGVSLDVARDNPSAEEKMTSVEKCTCPETFTGHSCESCIAGFRRIGNVLYDGKCEKCECNGHSSTCDPYTGYCLDCKHGTSGDHCELCLQGHYGNPILGGEAGSCKQCGCPLLNPENNFSPTCTVAELGSVSGDGDYICTSCSAGYVGQKCEMCDDGYFGDPKAVNGSCEKCDCNGNIDEMAIGSCDSISGKCLKCIYNTEGDHCEKCKENFYGSAFDQSCRACGCHLVGSKSPKCDNGTGACDCNEFYIGMQCDNCAEGHGDIENDCPECQCNKTGSFGDWCDSVSGQCQCKYGVFGKRCDTCKTGYFGFTDQGCTFCGCDQYGSEEGGSCDPIDGQCICRQNVTGKMCDKCKEGYFNISSSEGCHQCLCHSEGAENTTCHLVTGQCKCKTGVAGIKCEKCAPNYYGLSNEGCKECPVCPAPGQVCDPKTGECVCPPNTIGEMCENCTENTWNYHSLKGCTLCDCNSEGSDRKDCDSFTGQCHCRDGYTGLKCDSCIHGHFDFPSCRKCKCNKAGTHHDSCIPGKNCACDESGQCPCKENVEGDKCQKCKAHSFSLERNSPNGCTQCFCFNRTNFCIQGSYVWQQIYADNRHAMFIEPYLYYKEVRGYRIFPDDAPTINSYPTDYTPLYWAMPKKFAGDRVTSYNGFLRFRLVNENERYGNGAIRPETDIFRRYPLVVLVGSHRIVLEYYPKDEFPESGRFKIRLREDMWRSKSTPEIPVTRKQLMVALQNLQEIYIRGTFAYGVSDASMNDITLDVAVSVNTTEGMNNTAIGVETCGDCPQGYAGNSCQTAAQGYCRKRKADYLDSENDLDLVGWSEPCKCSGHSTTCDPETCRCTDCQHNTEGDFCDRCMSGYYGDARKGTHDSCVKCACPLAHNSFSRTCYATDAQFGKGYLCDACLEGYTGMYCERCMDGYYGDPNVSGGKCMACDCHIHGALHSLCDGRTGQCQCREAVTGRDCSECQPRHALVGATCTSCDQGCTLDLMKEVDQLEITLSSQNFSGLVPVPWKRLSRVENRTYELEQGLKDVNQGKDEAKKMVDSLGDTNKYLQEAQGTADQAKFVFDRINKTIGTVEQCIKDGEDVKKIMRTSYGKAWELVHQLQHYATHGSDQSRPIDASGWLEEAEEHLKAMKERDSYIDKRYNRAKAELQLAKELLEKVTGHKLNDTTFELLYEKINKFGELVDDSRDTLWDDARRNALSAQKIDEINRKSMENFQTTVEKIEDLTNEAEDHLQSAANKVKGAKEDLILDLYDDYKKANESLLPELLNATEELRTFSHQYSDLVNEYRGKYLHPAQTHADQLERQASIIKDSFRETKHSSELALSASGAYTDIVGALKNATKAGEMAKEAAEKTYETAYPVDETSLVDLAENRKNTSLDLLEEATNLGVEDLVNDLKGYEKRLGDVNENTIRERKKVDEIKRGYTKFDDQHDTMQEVHQLATKAKESAKSTEDAVSDIAKQVDKMVGQVEQLTGFTGQGIRGLTEDVSKTARQVGNAKEKLGHVQQQANANDEHVAELGEKLAELKEKIKEAREKASRIKIAVESDANGKCRRSYISPAHPTPSNIIHVKYRPLPTVTDSLILFTQTKRRRTQPSEYLALELKDKRVIFHWDIGSDQHMITNTLNINSIPAQDQKTWYAIDVKREGNGAMLNVSEVKTSVENDEIIESKSVQESFEDDSFVFNTVPGRTLIELGVQNDKLPPDSAISVSEFRGAMGELVVDGKNLALWSFHTTTDECNGAVKPVAPPLARGFMFRDGYAQINMDSGNDYKNFMLRFSAYSPNGLLYFRGSQKGDFISFELQNGNVVMQFYLGGKSHLRLETTQRSYNDGRQHVIFASRNGKEGTLEIRTSGDSDEAEKVAGVATGEMTSLNVKEALHYVGGVPTTYNKTQWNNFDITWSAFYGCISLVQPDRGVTLNLKLANKTLNVEEGCSFVDDKLHSSDRVVSFEPPSDADAGYFLIEGIELGNDDATMGFGFRTYQANATLLYQSSRVTTYRRRVRETKQQGFIAVYLYGGYLAVHLGTDAKERSKVATLRSGSTYNDGMMHSMLLRRDGEILTLMVDDRVEGTETLKDDATIGSCDRGCDQIFLGGVPERIHAPVDELPTKTPLKGCISDFYYNYKRKPFVPQELKNSLIGKCLLKGVEQPETTQAEEPLQADGNSWARVKTNKLHFNIMEPTVEMTGPTRRHRGPAVTTGYTPLTTLAPPTTTPEAVCTPPELREVDSKGAVRYGVTESSHTKLRFQKPYPDAINLTISFAFKTDKPTGYLVMWTNLNKFTKFLKIIIIDGRVQLRMVGGRSMKNVTLAFPDEKRFDDGQWHTVNLKKRESEVTFQVDDNTVDTKKAPSNIGPTKRTIYVGGILNKHRAKFNITFPQFSGCIRDFEVDHVLQELQNDASRDVILCIPPTSHATYVYTGGYLTFASPKYPTGELQVELVFLTDKADGRILTLGRTNSITKNRLTVKLVNGRVQVSVVYEEAEVGSAVVDSPALCDGDWHKVEMQFNSQDGNVIVIVDSYPPARQPIENAEIVANAFVNVPLHVGGLPGSAMKKVGGESLMGCFTSLAANFNKIRMESARTSKKTIPKGCIFA